MRERYKNIVSAGIDRRPEQDFCENNPLERHAYYVNLSTAYSRLKTTPGSAYSVRQPLFLEKPLTP